MIDLNTQLAALEKLFQLMKDYKVQEVSVDYVHVVMPKHVPEKPAVTEQELLAKHLEPLPQEPWESIPDTALQAWHLNGGSQ